MRVWTLFSLKFSYCSFLLSSSSTRTLFTSVLIWAGGWMISSKLGQFCERYGLAFGWKYPTFGWTCVFSSVCFHPSPSIVDVSVAAITYLRSGLPMCDFFYFFYCCFLCPWCLMWLGGLVWVDWEQIGSDWIHTPEWGVGKNLIKLNEFEIKKYGREQEEWWWWW